MDRSIIFILLFIAGAGVAYYFWQEHEASLVLLEPEAINLVKPVEPQTPVTAEQTVRYPVPERVLPPVEKKEIEETVDPVAEEFLLPTLDKSDTVMAGTFSRFYNAEKLAEIFIFREFVRHVVVSIDNLTTKKLPRRFVFTQKPDPGFMVAKTTIEDEFILDKLNFGRYQRFINFADAVDNQQLISVYVRYYPLFQQAYEELGYPGRYFNDRLIAVIDHLLQVPDIQGPIKLLRPKVFYQFVDPALENLSSGQKILLRIGSENALLVKTRLKALRNILTTLQSRQ